MNLNQGVSCQICSLQRNPTNIVLRESRLLKGYKMMVCRSCDARNLEPRHLIIIVGRQKGYQHVLEYIEEHRYIGEPITAKELLK